MAKILILIGGHLCTAPRPQKEAETLASAGHDVTVRGFWFKPEFVERDRQIVATKQWRFEPILDFQPVHRWRNLNTRLHRRFARTTFKQFGIFSPVLLGYGAYAMLRAARQMQADLTIVHSEAGLWVGNQLLKAGFRVGVDFEDWFSEDLLPGEQAVRPIAKMKDFERHLLNHSAYCITTSHALADALSKVYQAPLPTVIYNTFPWSERQQIDRQIKDRHDLSLPSLHWFSQTIGPGRGLETLFQALPLLNQPVEVHLRGDCLPIHRQWLESVIPKDWSHRIFIHPTVPNHELLSRIAEHDIGLALENSDIPSRNLTITNKLFQYLQAGLAVVATDTAGQREVFSKFPKIGRLSTDKDPIALAAALNDLLSHAEILTIAKAAALKAASTALCWEQQSNSLLAITHSALTERQENS
jgi:glycosyltransferase involved in cell wall biosynthesis